MALLSADQIVAADDRAYEDVPVPEWGGEVRVIGLSGTDRDAYEAAMVEARQTGKGATLRLQNFRSKLVAKCLIDQNGERLFTDDKVKVLGAKSGAVIDRLFDTARRLSGMSKDAVDEGKDDSEPAPSDAST